MKRTIVVNTMITVLCALPAVCQRVDREAPIYRVTVIERTVKAINYQYRSGPTTIDFRGTVLMPKAKGDAIVESKRGRTEIDAKLDNIEDPQRFGREYLTYVLWAISPEGRPHNLGEVMPNGSNKARLRLTTDLQAFGLIVTAEPYSAVRQPSNVVVAENVVRPDTVGKIEEIQAKYELMPRGHYVFDPHESLAWKANSPKVSMSEYEALTELYQAENAVGIARVASAEQYAPNTFAKAQQLLAEARRLQGIKAGTSLVVQSAREAAQTAEDARVISERRQQEENLTKARSDVSQAQQAKLQADAESLRAKGQADAAREQAEAERAARQRAEANAAAAEDRAARAEAEAQANRTRAAVKSAKPLQDPAALQKSEFRMRLLEQLNGVLITRDTPRGLIVTIPDAEFNGPELRGVATGQIARVASIVAVHPGLRVEVEGNTDSAATEALSLRRAEAVRGVVLGGGLPTSAVTARGLGNTRPLTSNASAAGRVENRRVEIVISGDPIGSMPFWDHSYTLSLR
jgi:outer membrane protein OmpA-like peptidoglycan-associated protein